MGRTDAVQFTRDVAAECERLGARITWEAGWDTRGNGTSANYEGGLVHHTASNSSEANPFPTQRILRDGRPDLSGPLCNMAGPWCRWETPWLHVVSARPGNHAGASGGRSMGPLPVTSSFNSRVFGLEVDYAGLSPMTAGQYRAACIFGKAVTTVLGRPSAEWVRAHAETSITGKWDPGYANGKTIDMAAFRRDVWATTTAAPIEDEDRDMARIIRSAGRPDALSDGPLFIGLNGTESGNFQNRGGLKVVDVTNETWDALAEGKATGQPSKSAAS